MLIPNDHTSEAVVYAFAEEIMRSGYQLMQNYTGM